MYTQGPAAKAIERDRARAQYNSKMASSAARARAPLSFLSSARIASPRGCSNNPGALLRGLLDKPALARLAAAAQGVLSAFLSLSLPTSLGLSVRDGVHSERERERARGILLRRV